MIFKRIIFNLSKQKNPPKSHQKTTIKELEKETEQKHERPPVDRVHHHVPRKPTIGKNIGPTNSPELKKSIMEARAKIPKTLDPLIASEHALSRKSTAAISLSLLKPLDVRNTKIYPKRELVGHSSSCSCSLPNSPAWDFDDLFKSKFNSFG